MNTTENSPELANLKGHIDNGTSADVTFPDSELLEPLWAVISFEKCEAAELAYDAARETLGELESRGVSGLCIVTGEAAGRIGG